ncbi:MAG: hypothetical protein ACXV7J_01475 [Methylomonas sp.]
MNKSAAVCRGCGARLTVLQTVRGLCDDPECRRKDVAYQEELRRLHKLARIREAIPEAWQADTSLAILPRNQQRLIPLGHERINAHRRYLEQIVQEAAELHDAGVAPAETSATTCGVSPAQANLAVLGAACGLCGGYCCNTGGNTAWLEPDSIVRLFGAISAVDWNAIVENYLSHLPEISFENSCIYHAENGCSLPKNIRSGVCNQYLCRGLAEVAHAVSAVPYRCVAATLAGSRIDEMALVDAQGILDRFKPETAD